MTVKMVILTSDKMEFMMKVLLQQRGTFYNDCLKN